MKSHHDIQEKTYSNLHVKKRHNSKEKGDLSLKQNSGILKRNPKKFLDMNNENNYNMNNNNQQIKTFSVKNLKDQNNHSQNNLSNIHINSEENKNKIIYNNKENPLTKFEIKFNSSTKKYSKEKIKPIENEEFIKKLNYTSYNSISNYFKLFYFD